MKRFLVFMFKDYYPEGGVGDFKGLADNMKEIKEIIETVLKETENEQHNINILDSKTMQKIEKDKDWAFDILDISDQIDEKEMNLLSENIDSILKGDE